MTVQSSDARILEVEFAEDGPAISGRLLSVGPASRAPTHIQRYEQPEPKARSGRRQRRHDTATVMTMSDSDQAPIAARAESLMRPNRRQVESAMAMVGRGGPTDLWAELIDQGPLRGPVPEATSAI